VFRPTSTANLEAARAGSARTTLSTAEIAQAVIRRHYWVIIVCATLSALGGAGYLSIIRPVYSASATMIVDSRRGGIQQKSILGDEPNDGGWIDSQIAVLALERPKIGEAIADRFASNADPDLLNNDNFDKNIFKKLTGLFGQKKKSQDEEIPQSTAERARILAAVVANGIEIKRVGLSYLLNVSFSSHSEQLGAKIVNAAADEIVVSEMKAKEQDIRQASDWLQDRYQTLRDQASAADRAVVEFKNKNHIIISDGKPIYDQQINVLNSDLGGARARAADARAKLEEITKVLKEQERTGLVDSTVPDAMLNPIVTKLRSDYLDLINKEAQWSKRFGENHQAVVNLRNEAQDLRNSTHEELKRIAEGYKSDLEIAENNAAELERQLAKLVDQTPSDAQIALRGLEATAQSYRNFYDNFFLHYTESIQQQSSPIPDTRVISYASYSYQTYPSPSRVMTLSLLGGIFFGFGIGFLREKLDQSLRTGSEVENFLGRECLATIPYVGEALDDGRLRHATRRLAVDADNYLNVSTQRIIHSFPFAARTLVEDPFSPFAEAIRALKMSADVRSRESGCRVIGFTSSLPREGKSAISTALGTLSGLVGARTILVDCDLRNPALSYRLAPNATAGLLEVITGASSLDEVIWRETSAGIDFLPAANVLGLSNTAQLLASNSMKRLFDDLRDRYEYVIVDLSPVLPIVDVRATVELIDYYVFVIEWGTTKSEIIRDALNSSRDLHEKILGFALNKVDSRSIHRYSYYSVGYNAGNRLRAQLYAPDHRE
jgi:polysaccharide biosynthesis transport protein